MRLFVVLCLSTAHTSTAKCHTNPPHRRVTRLYQVTSLYISLLNCQHGHIIVVRYVRSACSESAACSILCFGDTLRLISANKSFFWRCSIESELAMLPVLSNARVPKYLEIAQLSTSTKTLHLLLYERLHSTPYRPARRKFRAVLHRNDCLGLFRFVGRK